MGYLSSTEAADSSVVRKLAEQAFGRSVGPIVPMVGLVAYNFQVNNDRIFKIASSRSNINDWQRMVVNSPVLQRHLSVEIPMPTLHILQHENREIPAISYERLPGMVITRQMFAEANDTFKKDYIAKLNEKIYELHQVSPDILPARPLSVFQQAANMLFNHKRARKYVPKLTEYLFPL